MTAAHPIRAASLTVGRFLLRGFCSAAGFTSSFRFELGRAFPRPAAFWE